MELNGMPPVKNWHMEAYRAGRIDEIEPALLPLVKERVEAQDALNRARDQKPTRQAVVNKDKE